VGVISTAVHRHPFLSSIYSRMHLAYSSPYLLYYIHSILRAL
jgi:hypothetical protein